MAEYTPVVIDDVAGGVHEGLHPGKITDREWTELSNMFPYGKEIFRRPGLNRITSTAFSGGELTGLFAYKQDTGDWALLFGHKTGLAKLDGTGIVSIPISDAATYTSSLAPWNTFQYANVMYWARESTGTFKRAKSDFVQDAGLEAPATAPTLSDGGTGTLTAADYYGVFTHYNTETGNESNPSPVSAVLTLGASKQISWTGITVSLNGQINARRLYRVLPDQTGEYFFVDQISDNFTTTYASDDFTADEMGDSVSFRNGEPPANISIVCLHEERNFCSDGVNVYYSQLGKMECYDPSAVIVVFPDDGHVIRALYSWGSKLFIGRTKNCVLIAGEPGAFSREILSSEHGCYSHHSVKSVENLLIWYGGDDFYASVGSSPLPIGDSKVKDTLEAVPEAYKDRVIAQVIPTKHLYVANIPGADGTYEKMLCYNYRTQAWVPWEYPAFGSGGPRFFGYFYDADYDTLIYATFEDGHVYDMFSSSLTDNGEAIVCAGVSKAFGFTEDGSMSVIRNIQLQCPTNNSALTVKLRRNLASTAYKSRSVNLSQAQAWKRIGLSNHGAPASALQLEFSYSGSPDFSISGIAYEVCRMGQRIQGKL